MSLYGVLSEIAFRAARPFLCRKYDEGNDQRYGRYPPDTPRGSLWVHAVSVGEVQSAYPFVKRVKETWPDLPVLLSTITETGKAMAAQLMGPLARQIYYPWDAPSVVGRALDSLRPKAYVTIETEIWPEMLDRLQKTGVPAFLVNARLSRTSYEKYARFRRFWGPVIRRYALVLTRSEVERERFIRLGADPARVVATGDCKVDALVERKRTADVQGARRLLSGGGPAILAGSTHEGEETVVLDAYRTLRARFDGLRLVVAPRHPERSGEVADEARALGLDVCLMSAPRAGWNVMVVDRIGVLFPLYGCVDAAFLGGSLTPRGGQNIMEPAIWGVPFCQGPDYRDFAAATDELVSAGVCAIVRDAGEMSRFFESVLREDDRSRVQAASRRFFAKAGGASARNLELIRDVIRERRA